MVAISTLAFMHAGHCSGFMSNNKTHNLSRRRETWVLSGHLIFLHEVCELRTDEQDLAPKGAASVG
jgi:hypothetical protein